MTEIKHIEYEINLSEDYTCIGDVGDFDHLTESTEEYARDSIENYLCDFTKYELVNFILNELKIKKVWFEIVAK